MIGLCLLSTGVLIFFISKLDSLKNMSDLEPLPSELPLILESYLPHDLLQDDLNLPFVTLTYAQSLDSRISARPGTRTVISHAQTKTMTHYIRSKHDGILVGINTVLADNPSLNCRYPESNSIVPIIIDPSFKFSKIAHTSKLIQNYKSNSGEKPIVVISTKRFDELKQLNDNSLINHIITVLPVDTVEDHNGKDVFIWASLLKSLKLKHSIKSIMIEGGAHIINTLLNEKNLCSGVPLVNSLIITIGPVFLGQDGVDVSPTEPLSLKNIKWWTGIQDSVMCATL